MPSNEPTAGAGPQVAVVPGELRTGSRQLHDLAEQTKDELTPSDRAHEARMARHALRCGLRGLCAVRDRLRRSRRRHVHQGCRECRHTADHYENTDNTSADSMYHTV